MITAELKDRVLQYLIENQRDTKLTFDEEEVAQKLGMSPEYLNVILDSMVARRFLEKDNAGSYYTMTWLNSGIFDFYSLGGYKFEDHIIEKELVKLKNNIEQIKSIIDQSKYQNLINSVDTIIQYQQSLSGK